MPQECKLLEGPAAASAQLLLATAAIGALVYKRQKEHPQRSLQVWGMDISKQIISAAAAHVCGIFIAILASGNGTGHVSQCAWYFVAYSFDTTLGVAVAVGIHTLAVRLCSSRAATFPHIEHHWCRCIAECGEYGTPPSWKPFLLQMAEWTGAVILARIICGSVVIGTETVLLPIARVLDDMFWGHPVLLLFFVMIMCPLVMNVVQALVQDAVLKFKEKHSDAPSTPQEKSPGGSGRKRAEGEQFVEEQSINLFLAASQITHRTEQLNTTGCSAAHSASSCYLCCWQQWQVLFSGEAAAQAS
ncbi:hypothetical protein WJX75_002720 [Coccomyxa subellipsoidea]|uniref:TLC domain-containing protein n=1 Tax=Coccomyxa subellipsoidea TaxID=248742 RepID=A0ABR2YXA4_9CHLO